MNERVKQLIALADQMTLTAIARTETKIGSDILSNFGVEE